MADFLRLKSVFKTPDTSVVVGLAEAGIVYAVYNQAIPSMADIRTANPHDTDIEAARRHAAWESTVVIGLVFLLTRDINSTLIGGAALAGMDLMVKHANGVNPQTGKLQTPGASMLPADADNATAFPLPDYSQSMTGEDAGY